MGSSLKEVLCNIDYPVCYCYHIGSSLNFAYDSLSHCCIPSGALASPTICKFNGGSFPTKTYLLSFEKFVIQNMLHKGECTNCDHLNNGRPSDEFVSFKYISLNHFWRCNLSCSYCHGDWRKSTGMPYNVVPALQDMYNQGFINHNTVIAWGGGEPSLYEYVNETVNFCTERKIIQHIDTTAVKFSEAFANTLRCGLAILRVSPDSGTQETYKRVKGADRFFEVWENINQYNKICNIRLKYILTPDNLNEEDIYGFVKMCVIIGITHVFISTELHYYREIRTNDAKKSEKDLYINAATKLYAAITENQIKAELLFWLNQDMIDIVSKKSQ